MDRILRNLPLAAAACMLAACAAPTPAGPMPTPTDRPPTSAPSPTASLPPTSTPSPTAAPSLTPTPTQAPGSLPLSPEDLARFAELWSRDESEDQAVSGCYLTDCYHESHVLSLAFSPDGNLLALGRCDDLRRNDSDPDNYRFFCRQNPTILILEAASGRTLTTLAAEEVPTSLAFDPSGRLLAAGLANRTIEIWDLERGERIHTLYHSSERTGVVGLAFSGDGSQLFSEGDSKLQVWDLPTLRLLDTIPLSAGIAISADGNWMATEHIPGGRDGAYRIRLYDMPYNGQFRELPVQLGLRLAFSPDGRLLAAFESSYRVQLWDLGTQARIDSLDGLAMEGDEQYLISRGFTPQGLNLWFASQVRLPGDDGLASEPSDACGPVLWDLAAGRGWYYPVGGDDCYSGDLWKFTLVSSGQITLDPTGRLVALDDGTGELSLWGIDPGLAPAEPVCLGACGSP